MLSIQNLCLAYSAGKDQVLALDSISLNIAEHDFVVVLGPSGCGKTSLLNVLAGFLQPTSGQVLLDGRELTGPGRDRGVVFQKNALMPWLSVRGNAAFGLKLQGVPRAERRVMADRYLAQLGLSEFADSAVFELSGGMQQRLGLARALAADPRMLLMDEPFGALDALTRESMQELILSLWSATGKTVFFITHSVEEAMFLGTRVLVMSPRPGRILASREIPFSRQFVEGRGARDIKSDPAYIAMREEVLAMVLGVHQSIGQGVAKEVGKGAEHAL